MDIQRVQGTDPLETVVEQAVDALRNDGVVIVEGLLSPDVLARFNAELDPLLDAARPDPQFINDGVAWFFGSRTRHITGVAGKSRTFATEILPHDVYKRLSEAVLGPSCARVRLNLAHVLDRGPGSDDQLIHRDHDIWVHLPRPHDEYQLSSVIALVDFTAENGATRVIPGSHEWDPGREPTPDELVPAEMPAGSAVIYLGSMLHCGGANVTDGVRRRGMHLSYCVGWLRTEENQFL